MLCGPFGALLVLLHLALPGHADVVFTAEPCDRASFGLRPIQGDASRYKQCGPSGKVWIVPCAPHMSFDPVERVCKEADEPRQLNRRMEKARSRRPVITTPHPTAEEFVFSTVRPKRPRIKGKGKRIKTTTPKPSTMLPTTYVTEEPAPLMPEHPAPAFPPPGRGTTVRPEYTVKYNGENMTEEELLRRLVDLVKAQKASAAREKQEKEERQRLEMERRRMEEERRIAQERAEMEERIRQEEERIEAERREIQRKEEERVRIREEKKKKEEERKKAMAKAEAARKKLEEEERLAAIEKKRREEELRQALEKAEYERMENEKRIAEEMAERERVEAERMEQMRRIEEAKREQERLERLRKEEKEKREREKEELMRRERERAERIREEMERQLELERKEMERQMFNKYATTTMAPDFEIIRFPPQPTKQGSFIPPLPQTTTTTSSPWVTSEHSWRPPVDIYPTLMETTSEMPRTTASPRVLDGCIPNGDCPFSYDGDHFCPHPDNPALYLQCAPMIGRRGRWTTRRCPDGLLFSTHLGRCEKDPYSAYNPNERVVIPRLPDENQHVAWTGNREIVTVTPVYVPQNKIYSTIDSFPHDLLPVVPPIHPQDLFKPRQAITEFDDYDELDLSKIHPLFPRVQPGFFNSLLPFQPLQDGEKGREEDNILGAVFKPFFKKVALKQTKNFLDRVLSDEEMKRLEEKDRLRGEGTKRSL